MTICFYCGAPDDDKPAKHMTPEQFENLREEFLSHEAKILDWKRGEYSPNEDRLQNFREVAGFLDQRLAEVALSYLLKHIQSIALAVRTEKYAWAWETNRGGEGLKQRIADARNYLLLLAACLEAEMEAKDETMPDVCTAEGFRRSSTLGRRDQG